MLNVALSVDGVKGGVATSGAELACTANDRDPVVGALGADVPRDLHSTSVAQDQRGVALAADRRSKSAPVTFGFVDRWPRGPNPACRARLGPRAGQCAGGCAGVWPANSAVKTRDFVAPGRRSARSQRRLAARIMLPPVPDGCSEAIRCPRIAGAGDRNHERGPEVTYVRPCCLPSIGPPTSRRSASRSTLLPLSCGRSWTRSDQPLAGPRSRPRRSGDRPPTWAADGARLYRRAHAVHDSRLGSPATRLADL